MSWEIAFFFITAVQGVIMSLFFLSDRTSKKKFFLGVYLLMFSITILHYVRFWAYGPLNNLHASVIWLCVISSLVMPSALYLSLKNPDRLKRADLLHLTPILIFSVLWIISFLGHRMSFFNENTTSLGKILLFVAYGIAMFRIKNIKRIDRFLLLGFGGFLLGLLFYRFSLQYGFYTVKTDYLVCGIFSVLIYSIAYYSQRGFLAVKVKPKYASSSLTLEDGQYLVEKINKALADHKYYHDPNFNLSQLSTHLKVPKYRISQALNTYSDKSFSELTNNYRITEAKKKLTCNSSHHLKLEAIGEEVGFSNKVSFYKNFKKVLGVSPGEYRKQQMESLIYQSNNPSSESGAY